MPALGAVEVAEEVALVGALETVAALLWPLQAAAANLPLLQRQLGRASKVSRRAFRLCCGADRTRFRWDGSSANQGHDGAGWRYPHTLHDARQPARKVLQLGDKGVPAPLQLNYLSPGGVQRRRGLAFSLVPDVLCPTRGPGQ